MKTNAAPRKLSFGGMNDFCAVSQDKIEQLNRRLINTPIYKTKQPSTRPKTVLTFQQRHKQHQAAKTNFKQLPKGAGNILANVFGTAPKGM